MVCSGCHADLPETTGPTHEYMLSSPACWAVFGELLAREYSNPSLMRLHRLTVDAYAVQHPGVDVPPARRSVGVHLSRLYLLLERGWPVERANDAMLVINRFKDRCEWLAPPSMAGTLTVQDVMGATSQDEHEERVMAWARSVWSAWGIHHETVRRWCASL
ncbi:hypothetical protein SAMN05421770_102451 [Granulicella rosea]|uniref:Uncharacterized protein n=1 Tax=Granulicella rosea TaxID=474952 RepID=A0A239HM06_9BACT|nr:DUF5946 family protein [Granulicella rosea]SNS82108.1 hypothetical protein SAMN05421770_102451 [Granulicella rosea]